MPLQEKIPVNVFASVKLRDCVVLHVNYENYVTILCVEPNVAEFAQLPLGYFEINLLAEHFPGECFDHSKPYVSHSHTQIRRPGEL